MDDHFLHTISNSLIGKVVSNLYSSKPKSAGYIELIDHIFIKRDANLILSIPLTDRVDDSWYWWKEKSGQYFVKSAYQLLDKGKENRHTSDNSGFWDKLWNLTVPPKVKNSLWRASTGLKEKIGNRCFSSGTRDFF
ncbi:hypothetical protein CsatB_011601 [Cannabis sativa]